jgi:hypothetical protein
MHAERERVAARERVRRIVARRARDAAIDGQDRIEEQLAPQRRLRVVERERGFGVQPERNRARELRRQLVARQRRTLAHRGRERQRAREADRPAPRDRHVKDRAYRASRDRASARGAPIRRKRRPAAGPQWILVTR